MDYSHTHFTNHRFNAICAKLMRRSQQDFSYVTGLLGRLQGLAERTESGELLQVVINLRIALLRYFSQRNAKCRSIGRFREGVGDAWMPGISVPHESPRSERRHRVGPALPDETFG